MLGVFVPEDQCDPRAARDAGVARPPDEPTLNTDVRVGEMDCQGQVALPSGEVTLRLRRHGGVVERRGRASRSTVGVPEIRTSLLVVPVRNCSLFGLAPIRTALASLSPAELT